MLTRKQRKERQNLLVRFGVPRKDTKGLRTYFDFVKVYNNIIDEAIESPQDATEDLIHFLAGQLGGGSMNLTVGDVGEKMDSIVEIKSIEQ